METAVVSRSSTWWPPILGRIEASAVGAWALVGGIVFYMAVNGGGYDLVVRSRVGVLVWWVVLLGAVLGFLPAGRLSRIGLVALGLFGAFLAWSAIASTWSISSERSWQEVSRVACYLGVFLLGMMVHRDRRRGVRHTINALALAIFLVAGLAVISRLRPDLFPAAQQTGAFIPDASNRLSWPLDYWNALAALLAFGLPLMFVVATSARTILGQAAAAGGIPVIALGIYLTFSRGGLLATVAGVIVFFALAPERLPKLATAAATAAGSAVLIAGAVHRSAIERGLATPEAVREGKSLVAAVLLVIAGTAIVQAGIALAFRHASQPRWLTVPVRRARWLLAGAIVLAVAIALAAGAPSRLSHAYQDFKHPVSNALHSTTISRFEALSGNGRYDYWKAAVDGLSGHVLGGHGPGTFQFVWLPRAPYASYVINAHSLYFETLSDVGIVGLALLLAFLLLVIGAAVRLVMRWNDENRTRAAGAAAALVAFVVSAAFDWVWQVPALPAAFLLLAAGVLSAGSRDLRRSARSSREGTGKGRSGGRIALGAGIAVVSVACLYAIAVPLATTTAERSSQTDAARGNTTQALGEARTATLLEPGGGAAQIQLALVLEVRGDVRAGLAAARTATQDDPDNWTAWLVRSRLEAEAGHASAAVTAFRRARSLNPRSSLLAT